MPCFKEVKLTLTRCGFLGKIIVALILSGFSFFHFPPQKSGQRLPTLQIES